MLEIFISLFMILLAYGWTQVVRHHPDWPIGSKYFRLLIALGIVLWTAYACFMLADSCVCQSAFEIVIQTLVILAALASATTVGVLVYSIEYDVFFAIHCHRRSRHEDEEIPNGN